MKEKTQQKKHVQAILNDIPWKDFQIVLPPFVFIKKVAQEGERKIEAYKKIIMANAYYSPLVIQC